MLGFSRCCGRSAREPRRVRGELVRVGSVQVPVGSQRLLRGYRQGECSSISPLQQHGTFPVQFRLEFRSIRVVSFDLLELVL
jgi:hypothetical protein